MRRLSLASSAWRGPGASVGCCIYRRACRRPPTTFPQSADERPTPKQEVDDHLPSGDCHRHLRALPSPQLDLTFAHISIGTIPRRMQLRAWRADVQIWVPSRLGQRADATLPLS